MTTSNPDRHSAPNGIHRKRKRSREAIRPQPSSHWRTEREQKSYSANLVDALRRVRVGAAAAPPTRAVREVADRALAAAARGRTRWSRAILLSRSARLRMAPRRKPLGYGSRSASGSARKRIAGSAPAIKGKARVLGRLVPGGRKMSLPALLDEASDYIAALEMQVRAMSALAGALSVAGAGAGESM